MGAQSVCTLRRRTLAMVLMLGDSRTRRSHNEGLVATWDSRPWPQKGVLVTRVLVNGLPRVTQAGSEAVGTLPGSRL